MSRRTFMALMIACLAIGLILRLAGIGTPATPTHHDSAREERETYRHGLIFSPEPKVCEEHREVACEREKRISREEEQGEHEVENARKGAKRAAEEAEGVHP